MAVRSKPGPSLILEPTTMWEGPDNSAAESESVLLAQIEHTSKEFDFDFKPSQRTDIIYKYRLNKIKAKETIYKYISLFTQ